MRTTVRIWMINHYAMPTGYNGGTRHASLAERLQSLGHRVTVFASSVTYGGAERLVPDDAFGDTRYADREFDGVAWRVIKGKPYRNNADRFAGMWAFGRRVPRALDGLDRPDVVIGSCVHPFAVEAGRRIARRLGVPFVYEIRDIWPESMIDIGGMSPWHPACLLFRRLELRAFRDAAGVVTLFPGMGPYVARHGVPEERVCYLPNGIDGARYPELPLRERGPVFRYSYFGTHGPANDLRNVLDAAERVLRARGDKIEVRLVGTGVDKPALVKHAEQRGLTNVRFLDPVPKEQLRGLAAETDAFLHSHKEMPVIKKYGLSANKLFEYLVYGRPIVFSCSSYNDPIAEAGAGLSVPAARPDELAQAMIDLADRNHAEHAAMGQRGRAYALAKHDFGKLAGKLSDFLTSIASGGGAAQRSRAA